MSELTMFLYPWDVHREGIAGAVEQLRRLGATRIAVAAAYHSAEVITPRPGGPYVSHVEANRAHLPLPADAFSGLLLAPSSLASESPEVFPDLAERVAAAGMGLTAWVVGLHNSALAQAHPECAIENCIGDRSAHGLCPADPAAATYLRELAAAVARTGWFDRVLLESASYLLAGHGHPHELMAVRLDVRTRFLLSLCFCASCRSRANDRGIDADGLRARCCALLERTWESPLLATRAADEGLELAALLATDPDVGAYVRMRLDVVSQLVEAIAAELRRARVDLNVTTAVWGRPTPLNWIEGIDLAAMGRVTTQVAVTTYARDASDVARELDHVLETVPAERVMQLNTLWPEHHPGVDALLAKVKLGLSAGVREFGLYNFAMAPRTVAAWTRHVADLLPAR